MMLYCLIVGLIIWLLYYKYEYRFYRRSSNIEFNLNVNCVYICYGLDFGDIKVNNVVVVFVVGEFVGNRW